MGKVLSHSGGAQETLEMPSEGLEPLRPTGQISCATPQETPQVFSSIDLPALYASTSTLGPTSQGASEPLGLGWGDFYGVWGP